MPRKSLKPDSKSGGGNIVLVRVRPGAPISLLRFGDDFRACRAGRSPQHLCAKSTRLSKRQLSQAAVESTSWFAR
jgi:hypothetical protein